MSQHAIRNLTRNSNLVEYAEFANSFLSRGMGLMGRKHLPANTGLILYPNNNIHMFFMRFAIDVIFVDRQHRVVGLRENFKPWRPFAGAAKARYTLELPVGVIQQSQTQLGDQLAVVPAIF